MQGAGPPPAETTTGDPAAGPGQRAAGGGAAQAAAGPSTKDRVARMLEENQVLILAVLENQNCSRFNECDLYLQVGARTRGHGRPAGRRRLTARCDLGGPSRPCRS